MYDCMSSHLCVPVSPVSTSGLRPGKAVKCTGARASATEWSSPQVVHRKRPALRCNLLGQIVAPRHRAVGRSRKECHDVKEVGIVVLGGYVVVPRDHLRLATTSVGSTRKSSRDDAEDRQDGDLVLTLHHSGCENDPCQRDGYVVTRPRATHV
jgi:hypothetical protein